MMLAEMYGMMPSAKIDRLRERAAGEQVEQAEQAALAAHDAAASRRDRRRAS